MKLYFVLAMTIIAFGFYWFCDRILRARRARAELRRRRQWWHALSRAYEAEREADEQIWGV